MGHPGARTDLFAGVFLLVALCVLAVSIWILGSERQIFAKQAPFHLLFRDVQGLAEGAPVRLGGISIGRVAKIGFSSDLSDARVHVTVQVNEEFLDRVREDSVATIETQGLLGDKFVSVTAGSQLHLLTPGSTITTKERGDFGAILAKAEALVQNTVEMSDQFKLLVQEARKDSLVQITESFQNIAAITKEIRKGDGTLHRMIYGHKDADTLVTNMTEAAENLRRATAALARGSGTLGALLIDSRLYDNLVEVTGEAKRSIILRDVIRGAIAKAEKEKVAVEKNATAPAVSKQ